MTTMLEQSARALAVAWYCRADDDEEVKAQAAEQRPGFVVLARAALQAIREVPESISSVAKYDEYDWAGRNFTAMIDAILSESANP